MTLDEFAQIPAGAQMLIDRAGDIIRNRDLSELSDEEFRALVDISDRLVVAGILPGKDFIAELGRRADIIEARNAHRGNAVN